MTHEAASKARFAERVEAAYEAARARITARAWLTMIVIFFVFGVIVGVMVIGARAWLAGRLGPGEARSRAPVWRRRLPWIRIACPTGWTIQKNALLQPANASRSRFAVLRCRSQSPGRIELKLMRATFLQRRCWPCFAQSLDSRARPILCRSTATG